MPLASKVLRLGSLKVTLQVNRGAVSYGVFLLRGLARRLSQVNEYTSCANDVFAGMLRLYDSITMALGGGNCGAVVAPSR